MGEELDNELIINNGEENSSEEQIETSTSEGVEEVQTNEKVEQTTEDIEKQIEERANQLMEEKIEARLARDRAKREREYNEKFAKHQELENIINVGLGTKNIDEAINKASEFYKGQGINIPTLEKKTSLSERDAIVLAKADAQDIIKCGEAEMEAEANRIANIPREQRTVRENVVFNELCTRLVSNKNIKELKNKGYDVKVLDSEEFKEFSSHIIDKPITDVYDMYTKIHSSTKQQPKSPR